ncbi:hypothetical protein CW362_20090 [Streptomyces populi]|uniref:Uncharacterized protein n=1 Tax=Streptomyces populi TaxID=2058924 RepID=A0A2I0SMR0_9ACTN|nr:hypothetical protein CW362_20090 [Streptomyces populi]
MTEAVEATCGPEQPTVRSNRRAEEAGGPLKAAVEVMPRAFSAVFQHRRQIPPQATPGGPVSSRRSVTTATPW